MACAGSVVFPHIRRSPGSAARRGTIIHSFIEKARSTGRVKALEEISDPTLRNLCNAIDLALFPSYLESEVTYELNVVNGSAAGIDVPTPRDYPFLDHCFYGTADLIGLSEDGRTVIVIDIKTGQRLDDHASDNWQLRMLAVAAVLAHNAVDARAALAYIDPSGEVEFEWADFSSLDISDYLEELQWLDKSLRKASEAIASGYSIDLSVGDHCVWCPAKYYCPAYLDPLKSLDKDLAETKGMFEQLTPEAMGVLYDKLTLYDGAIDEMKSLVRTLAKDGPIDIGDGKQLKFVSSSRTVVDKERRRACVKWLANNGYIECLTPSIEDMSADQITKLNDLGFLGEIKIPMMRKVNK